MFVLTNTPKEFIPTSEKDNEKPLTFICIPPTRKCVLDIQEQLLKSMADAEETNEETTEVMGVSLPISKLMNVYFEACVIDWKNVFDADGKEVPFSKEAFNQFNDLVILTELYTFIQELAEGNAKT